MIVVVVLCVRYRCNNIGFIVYLEKIKNIIIIIVDEVMEVFIVTMGIEGLFVR